MPYGTIAAEIIQSGTAGQPPQFMDLNGVERGELCRAWVNFNGTGTVAIRAAFNVSSITDISTGIYTINFTNALTDTNYCVQMTVLPSASDAGAVGAGSIRSGTKTTNSIVLAATTYNDSVFADFQEIDVAVFR